MACRAPTRHRRHSFQHVCSTRLTLSSLTTPYATYVQAPPTTPRPSIMTCFFKGLGTCIGKGATNSGRRFGLAHYHKCGCAIARSLPSSDCARVWSGSGIKRARPSTPASTQANPHQSLCSSPSLPPFPNHTGIGLTLAPVILMILSLLSQGMLRQLDTAWMCWAYIYCLSSLSFIHILSSIHATLSINLFASIRFMFPLARISFPLSPQTGP